MKIIELSNKEVELIRAALSNCIPPDTDFCDLATEINELSEMPICKVTGEPQTMLTEVDENGIVIYTELTENGEPINASYLGVPYPVQEL